MEITGLPLGSTYREAVFPVSGGDEVRLIFPEGMTSTDIEDVRAHLSIILGRQLRDGS